MGSEIPGYVVKEIEAATKAKRVVLGFVEGLALGLGPEVFWVLWHCRPWRGRRRVVEEGIRFHLAELSCCEPRPPSGKREGSMTSFVDGDSNAVQNHCLAVPGFGSCHNVCG